MKTINRTIEHTAIKFTAYSFTDKSLFVADTGGYEQTVEDLTAEIERKYNCKVLEITSQDTKRYKLTIDIQKAIEIGTIEEVN